MQEFKNKILHGTIWSLVDNFSRQMVTMIVFILLARILSPILFGLLATAMLSVQFLKSIAFDSIATAIVRKANPSDVDYNTAFWACLGLSIPAFLALFFSAKIIESWVGAAGLAHVVQAVSFIVLTSGISRVHEARLTKEMRFKALALRSFVSVVTGGVVGVVMALNGYGIESLIAQQLTTSLVEFVFLYSALKWKPSFDVSMESFKEIAGFGKYVSITGATNFANQNSDIFFVTYFLGAAAAGFYSTGKRITNTLNAVISAALMRVSLPAFAQLQESESELRSTFVHSVAFTAMVTAPLFTGLAVLSSDIVSVLLGNKWLPSVPIMQIIAITGFLTSVGYYNQSIMLVKNKPQWQTNLTLLYAVTNVCAFTIFTRYGLVWTATAFAVRAVLLYPVSVWCAISLAVVPWKTYVKALVPAVSSSIVMASFLIIIAFGLDQFSPIVRLIILIPAGVFSYCIFLYIVSPLEYKNGLLDIIKKYQKNRE